jgi:histone H3/H4
MPANIPMQAIKKLVNKHAKVKITDDGAREIARILDSEAKRISAFAVKNAKKNKRDEISKKDILDYIIKYR